VIDHSRSVAARTGWSKRGMAWRIEELGALDQAGFVAALGDVYEHSPWVAARAFAARPFADRQALAAAMAAVVEAASEAEQLALLRAHPDLAGRAAIAGELTPDSRDEQKGAGLDRLTAAEHARFTRLNSAYRERFGFPFILAVKGADKATILQAFEQRLGNTRDAERAEALRQVHRIAGFRLVQRIAG
jgi:2-oxo-4-hydroxy-4-carboxy-5-ureidoimidazoline decarboxylase